MELLQLLGMKSVVLLVSAVADESRDPATKRHVEALLSERTARAYEMAAQILEDAFRDEPRSALLEALRRHTRRANVDAAAEDVMSRRKKLLTEIPFAAQRNESFWQIKVPPCCRRSTGMMLPG